MLSFSSHTLLWALIQFFSPFLEYKVWPVAIQSLPLHSSASSCIMDGVKMACRNTSVGSTSFQYQGKPSLIRGQPSPRTILFTTAPAGADVCVCSLVRPQIYLFIFTFHRSSGIKPLRYRNSHIQTRYIKYVVNTLTSIQPS